MIELKEGLKKRSKYEKIKLIESFNKGKTSKDGLFPQCIYCRKGFYLKILMKFFEK